MKTEIKKINETEYFVGESSIKIIEGNIIYVIVLGDQTEEIALAQEELSYTLTTKMGGRANYLIDLNKAGKNSLEARKTWKRISKHASTIKVALFGINPVAKVLASFVIGFKKNNNMRFFNTKDEALAWLKG